MASTINGATAPPTAGPAVTQKSRLASIDALRGAVMILMALDHTREFFHSAALSFSPEDLTRTTPLIFFTRWITHFCAPVFMFAAGLGAFLFLRRAGDPSRLTRFLWTRGLWLVVLEVTVIRLALNFSLDKGFVVLSVLWALGWSMIALSLLIRLPVRILAILSIVVIAGHNLLDSVNANALGSAGWLWNIAHQPGLLPAGKPVLLLAYPLIPWVAVMSAGFCFGRVLLLDAESRRRWTLRIGWSLTLGFLAIRAINVYGNPAPWSVQGSHLMTLVSFLNCTKYPPSLDFLLMTLGPALLCLAWLERFRMSPSNPLLIFGRVPLFYFVVHLFVIHAIAVVAALLRYGRASFLFDPLPSMGGPRELYPADFGYALWVVYAVWALVVALLYPACLWFARLKQRRNDWWLSYL